jgi:arylsulfatase A-like enzyme
LAWCARSCANPVWKKNTIIWFQSDNGGLEAAGPAAVGNLRGFKGSLYEGGIRVPSAVAWPAAIEAGRQVDIPASSADVLPTLSAIAGVPMTAYVNPLDGESLLPLLQGEDFKRARPVFFRHTGRLAAIDGNMKLLVPDIGEPGYELYDLGGDAEERHDLASNGSAVAQDLHVRAMSWSADVDHSLAGLDYGPVPMAEPAPPIVLNRDAAAYRALRDALAPPVSTRRVLFKFKVLAFIGGLVLIAAATGVGIGWFWFGRSRN